MKRRRTLKERLSASFLREQAKTAVYIYHMFFGRIGPVDPEVPLSKTVNEYKVVSKIFILSADFLIILAVFVKIMDFLYEKGIVK